MEGPVSLCFRGSSTLRRVGTEGLRVGFSPYHYIWLINNGVASEVPRSCGAPCGSSIGSASPFGNLGKHWNDPNLCKLLKFRHHPFKRGQRSLEFLFEANEVWFRHLGVLIACGISRFMVIGRKLHQTMTLFPFSRRVSRLDTPGSEEGKGAGCRTSWLDSRPGLII